MCGSTSTWSRSRSCRCTTRPQRPVVERDGTLIMVDDDRFRFEPGESPRSVGSGSAPSAATRCRARSSRGDNLPEIIQEMLLATTVPNERAG
jgi:sulfate adenylyltransferase subunit 2